jgi:hypothetical protein
MSADGIVNQGDQDVDCSGGPILLLERVGCSFMYILDGLILHFGWAGQYDNIS